MSSSSFATIISIETVENSAIVIYSGIGDYEFALDDYPFQDSNTFVNISPGIHTIYVKDNNNCPTAEQLFSVLVFPKFFTPNNDGENDTWRIKGINDDFYPNSSIKIFDRYGKLLKQLDPKGNGWDGTLNGKLLSNDDYWFEVTLKSGKIYRNHFTLKR